MLRNELCVLRCNKESVIVVAGTKQLTGVVIVDKRRQKKKRGDG